MPLCRAHRSRPPTAREPIAPWWHTALVLAPIAIGLVASWYQHGFPNANLPGMGSRLSGLLHSFWRKSGLSFC